MNPIPSTLRTGAELAAAGLIEPGREAATDAVGARYSVALSRHLAELIDRADPSDPIARQFVPSTEEMAVGGDELADPIGDGVRSPVTGLIHRYPDRVLLMPTLACPVYCRYCFRRNRVGRASGAPDAGELDAAFAYIEDREEIREVILSGGDPLTLSDARLARILQRIEAVDHVSVIRIHTRAPVAVPSRVTPGLVDALTLRRRPWMVVHCNHPRELSPEVEAAFARLAGAGVPLLSQSVLLRGVNDDADTLAELMRGLVAAGIKPYYLHHPDRAAGTAHFRLSLAEGLDLVRALRGRVSGLCQPTYVVDIPGGYGKVPVLDAVPGDRDGEWTLRDFTGREHAYTD